MDSKERGRQLGQNSDGRCDSSLRVRGQFATWSAPQKGNTATRLQRRLRFPFREISSSNGVDVLIDLALLSGTLSRFVVFDCRWEVEALILTAR